MLASQPSMYLNHSDVSMGQAVYLRVFVYNPHQAIN